jgi:hypothetical protein
VGVRIVAMLVNKILKILNTPIRFLLFIPELITTFILGLIIAIPPIGFVYVWIMTAIWLPFYGFIFGTSWLYKKVLILGIPLSVIGIPIVLIVDMFLQLMPNPDKEDKYNKALICDSYPFSMPSQLVDKLIPL